MYMKNNNNRGINKYLSSLLGQLFDLDIDIEEKITGYIENHGIKRFLKDASKIDLPNDVIDKIERLRLVLEVCDTEFDTNSDQFFNCTNIGGDFLNG
ncbi:UNVERIFIED_CONTAM: hypothetical protein Cloal_0200 [Acetivibrio alkalicellulosi]